MSRGRTRSWGPNILITGRLISHQWSTLLTDSPVPEPEDLAFASIVVGRLPQAPSPPKRATDTDEPIMALTNQASPAGPGARRMNGSTGGGRSERTWKLVALAATLALIGFITYAATRPHHPRPAAYPVTPPAALARGSEAPAFTLPRLGGGPPVSLAGTRGTPTVVNFFASWCRNCQAELSAFAALSTQKAGRVAIIGVDSNDANGSAAQRLLARAKATYPVGIDSDAKVATSFLLSALPVTYFLDSDGRVVHVAFGAQTLSSLDRWAGASTGQVKS